MNTTTRRGQVAAGAIVAGLAGNLPTATAADAPSTRAAEWKSERGIVVECTGEAHGLRLRQRLGEPPLRQHPPGRAWRP